MTEAKGHGMDRGRIVRTLEQNKKFHAMVQDLSKHTGVTPWKLKELIKWQLGLTMPLHGITIVKPTSKYEVEEMSDLIMEVRAWANTDLNYTFLEDRYE